MWLTFVSVTRADITLMRWSEIDSHLRDVQTPLVANGELPGLYSFYGDSAFHGPHDCIRTRHTPIPGVVNLTQRELDENKHMKRIRESIEWEYGMVSNLFRYSTNYRNFKLGLPNNVVMEEARFFHLICNCYVCFNGSQVGSDNTFGCNPPTFEDYMRP